MNLVGYVDVSLKEQLIRAYLREGPRGMMTQSMVGFTLLLAICTVLTFLECKISVLV